MLLWFWWYVNCECSAWLCESTRRHPIEFWMRFWMASRLCCCGFHSGYYRLGSRWTWTTACSNLLRIWIGKNYVIFFSIQIIVSLWCILLFCLLHDCEILHRNEVFSDRIEIEKTEVFWSHTGAKTIGPDILEIQILNIFRKSKYFVITFMFLWCLIQID